MELWLHYKSHESFSRQLKVLYFCIFVRKYGPWLSCFLLCSDIFTVSAREKLSWNHLRSYYFERPMQLSVRLNNFRFVNQAHFVSSFPFVMSIVFVPRRSLSHSRALEMWNGSCNWFKISRILIWNKLEMISVCWKRHAFIMFIVPLWWYVRIRLDIIWLCRLSYFSAHTNLNTAVKAKK